ncbi:pyridoxal-phosphate dependent enzyme [Lentzea sp. BCCO 10_0061]|uniref:Pyridoxal-phosphate dependent enzyme n=1 Tax=Lentzea sokolovensis TaxID=3095429 RepID=A0ABU4UUK6_9PSEU|nr:pyridoxal-phosphate dependent enzyme [Lentzea sp. BCCO 10_0061]MDX8142355.1 pyridoxal-phosphate dependent enzyme [Lentzea sp. BCCO 10_0061]
MIRVTSTLSFMKFSRPEARSWRCPPAPTEVRDFHAQLPDHAPTPLTELPSLAAELGIGRLFVKDESSRLGLPAFKALGASWAVHRVLQHRTGPVTLTTATDGNHGRAVARMARLRGQRAHVFVPNTVPAQAIEAIRAENAEVTVVDGTYDDAVARAAEADGILVQDMGWPGYEEIPAWIVEGYGTLCHEIDEQLDSEPDLVVIPVGVGSFAQAVITHYRSRDSRTRLLAVEPDSAACVLESLRAGERKTIPTGDTIMAGLNCGTPSATAWPYLNNGLDAAVSISEAECAQAMHDLHAQNVHSGPCGAAPLAGLRAIRSEFGDLATVVLISTEGRL